MNTRWKDDVGSLSLLPVSGTDTIYYFIPAWMRFEPIARMQRTWNGAIFPAGYANVIAIIRGAESWRELPEPVSFAGGEVA